MWRFPFLIIPGIKWIFYLLCVTGPRLSLHPSFVRWVTIPSACVPVKKLSHFPTQGWSIVLSLVILPRWRRGVQTCLCLPFRNHHFSRINSTPHSPADKVRCLRLGWGGGASCKTRLCSQWWMIACCVRHSSIRCCFWGGLEGGGCPQAEVAVAGNILMKLQM